MLMSSCSQTTYNYVCVYLACTIISMHVQGVQCTYVLHALSICCECIFSLSFGLTWTCTCRFTVVRLHACINTLYTVLFFYSHETCVVDSAWPPPGVSWIGVSPVHDDCRVSPVTWNRSHRARAADDDGTATQHHRGTTTHIAFTVAWSWQ